MMSGNYTANADITIQASSADVWKALTDPAMIQEYMFGATVVSDWHEGSTIIWKGQWKDKAYEDKGKILKMEPGRKLQYTHFSPLSGLPDIPANYHIVTIVLNNENGDTVVSLTQTNNADEASKDHSEKNWKMILDSLKKLLEGPN